MTPTPIWSRAISTALILLVGALASVLLVFTRGDALRQTVDRYPLESTEIYLHGIADDHAGAVISALDGFAEGPGRAVVRTDRDVLHADGSLDALRVGIATNGAAPPQALDLRFLGTTLIDGVGVGKLVTSDSGKSIGLDANSADVIAELPEIRFAPRLVLVQLQRLVETSGTVNGTYRIVGADDRSLPTLLSALEQVTGQSADSMRTATQGEATDNGSAELILSGFFLAAVLLLLLLLIVDALRATRALGVHLLVGRSAWRFTASTFAPVLGAGATAMVLAAVFTVLLMPGYAPTPQLLEAAASAAALAGAPVVACVGIAAALLVSIRPVDAILGRTSKRFLLWVISSLYVLAATGFSVAFMAVDGPITEVGNLTEVRQSWAAVDHDEILYHEAVGDDRNSFTGQSSDHAQDFYDWYRSIADRPGVGLVNTQYYDEHTLDVWQGVYSHIPEEPFWYVAASPSYLASQGFDVGDSVVARAENGERVFLLPDSWADATVQAMQGWLDEDSRVSGTASIVTEYVSNPVIGFEQYRPTKPLFAWNPDPSGPQRIVAPVILLSTPANMIPFESESLSAVGLANSYVKLSGSAAQTLTTPDYLARFHLDDNAPEFLPVSDFVAGLTKSIQSFIALYGTVALFLCLLCMVLITALTRLFTSTYREALAVKRLLGYSLIRLFAPAIIVVGTTGALTMLVAILARSTSAILGDILMFAVQAVLLVVVTRRYSRLHLSTTLKE